MTNSTSHGADPVQVALLKGLKARLSAGVGLEVESQGDGIRVLLRSATTDALPTAAAIEADLREMVAETDWAGETGAIAVEAWIQGATDPVWAQTFALADGAIAAQPSRWGSIGQVTQGVRSGLGTVVGQTAKVAGTVAKGTPGAIKTVGAAVGKTGKAVGEAVSQVGQAVAPSQNPLENATEAMGNLAQTAAQTVTETVATVTEAVGTATTAAAQVATETTVQLASQAGEALGGVVETVAQEAGKATQVVGSVVGETAKKLEDAAAGTGEVVDRTLKSTTQAVKGTTQAVSGGVAGAVKQTAAVPQGLLGLPGRLRQTQGALKAGGVVAVLVVLAVLFTAISMVLVLIKLGSL